MIIAIPTQWRDGFRWLTPPAKRRRADLSGLTLGELVERHETQPVAAYLGGDYSYGRPRDLS